MAKNRPIAGDAQGDRLRTGGRERAAPAKGILEGQVQCREIVTCDYRACGYAGAASGPVAEIECENDVLRQFAETAQFDEGFRDLDVLAIDTGANRYDAAIGWCGVDRGLNGAEITRTVGGDNHLRRARCDGAGKNENRQTPNHY